MHLLIRLALSLLFLVSVAPAVAQGGRCPVGGDAPGAGFHPYYGPGGLGGPLADQAQAAALEALRLTDRFDHLFSRTVTAQRDLYGSILANSSDIRLVELPEDFVRDVQHWSSRSGVIAHSIRLLLCRKTGASPHAPKHSPSFRVMRPSGVVSL